jgi:hypothetical protein
MTRMRLKLGNNNCHVVGSVDERREYAGTQAHEQHAAIAAHTTNLYRLDPSS